MRDNLIILSIDWLITLCEWLYFIVDWKIVIYFLLAILDYCFRYCCLFVRQNVNWSGKCVFISFIFHFSLQIFVFVFFVSFGGQDFCTFRRRWSCWTSNFNSLFDIGLQFLAISSVLSVSLHWIRGIWTTEVYLHKKQKVLSRPGIELGSFDSWAAPWTTRLPGGSICSECGEMAQDIYQSMGNFVLIQNMESVFPESIVETSFGSK